jgi:large subunit ribosomal protein L9
MKIILIKDVKKQGKSGDILEVKDGYGTFLINKGDAVLATSNSVNRLDRENKEKEVKENNLIKECEVLKKKLENLKISFKVKTGEHDRVFGSVSAKQIVEELKNKGYNIDKKQVKINNAISALGFHNVDIELHKKVIATIKIELKK